MENAEYPSGRWNVTDKEILLDLTQYLADCFHNTIGEMSLDALSWQPDPEANSIAVTAWHIGRLLEDLWARILENRPAADQLWLANGWSARTGYDPRGRGWGGWGMLAGYTQAEVEEIPVLSADDLTAYFDEACEAFRMCLQSFPADAFDKRAPGALDKGPDTWTSYRCLKVYLMNGYEHIGEIRAFKAMYERQKRTS